MARKHPAYLYTYPLHARRAVLDTDFAERAMAALGCYPAYGALTARYHKAFWVELGRALQERDAATVAGACEILADTLAAKRITVGEAARVVRDWRLGRMG
ncbi:hypothetical protein AAFN86_16070 [Roseomonas sp. CAU 1739]|uniref:hypothetical protein n=1 Tax=Roseomonas sp. CAU 1739 TaxID=3140364 RepID=UPI00325ACD0F